MLSGLTAGVALRWSDSTPIMVEEVAVDTGVGGAEGEGDEEGREGGGGEEGEGGEAPI